MTEEERFRFDLTGFTSSCCPKRRQVGNIIDQIDRIKHNPDSLSPEHRSSNWAIKCHYRPSRAIESSMNNWSRYSNGDSISGEKGQQHGGLHGGGPNQIDQIFGYRSQNGKIRAGMVRVIFELTDISKETVLPVFF